MLVALITGYLAIAGVFFLGLANAADAQGSATRFARLRWAVAFMTLVWPVLLILLFLPARWFEDS